MTLIVGRLSRLMRSVRPVGPPLGGSILYSGLQPFVPIRCPVHINQHRLCYSGVLLLLFYCLSSFSHVGVDGPNPFMNPVSVSLERLLTIFTPHRAYLSLRLPLGT